MHHYRPKRLQIEKNSGSLETTAGNVGSAGRISTINDLCSDIWQQIFEYFETIELYTTFVHINTTIHQLLFNENERFHSRGLTLDADLKDLPEQIPLNRVVSLMLHDTCSLKIIDQCSELRLLKLIGTVEWVITLVTRVTYKNTKLEQLTVVVSRIGSLSELLMYILPIFSLRRLELCADDLEESDRICTLTRVSSNIEQFVLSSSSTIDWNNLLGMLPDFTNIRLLSISLIDRDQKTIPSFILHNLRALSLGLHEVSFNWIIQLVATIPGLIKLKLSGLVDGEGFVVNERWHHLFDSAPTLVRIFVNVSLEQAEESYHCEKLRSRLRTFNLQLILNDDDNDCCMYYGKVHRWWNLIGLIIKPYNYL